MREVSEILTRTFGCFFFIKHYGRYFWIYIYNITCHWERNKTLLRRPLWQHNTWTREQEQKRIRILGRKSRSGLQSSWIELIMTRATCASSCTINLILFRTQNVLIWGQRVFFSLLWFTDSILKIRDENKSLKNHNNAFFRIKPEVTWISIRKIK